MKSIFLIGFIEKKINLLVLLQMKKQLRLTIRTWMPSRFIFPRNSKWHFPTWRFHEKYFWRTMSTLASSGSQSLNPLVKILSKPSLCVHRCPALVPKQEGNRQERDPPITRRASQSSMLVTKQTSFDSWTSSILAGNSERLALGLAFTSPDSQAGTATTKKSSIIWISANVQ